MFDRLWAVELEGSTYAAIKYAILALALLPSAIWITLDRRVFSWDQAWYGQVSVDLYDTLTTAPDHWLEALVTAFGIKAPAIAWIGQFLVPFGRALGALDTTLLGLSLGAALVTLLVLHPALQTVAGGNNTAALLGVIAVATAPLFVGISHQFLVESLQTLAVAWLLVIAVKAPELPRHFILLNLIAAASFALLVKVSSPLYCVVPGALAGWWVLANERGRDRGARRVASWAWQVSGVSATVFGLGAIGWYWKNWTSVLEQVGLVRAGPVADLYGTPAPMIQKLPFWLNAMQHSYFLPVVGVLFVVIALAGMATFAQRARSRLDYPGVLALAALLELLAILLNFASATPEETRYLVPGVVYIGVIVAWALGRIDWLFSACAAVALGFQFALVNGQALGMLPPNPDASAWLVPLLTDSRQDGIVDATTRATCNQSSLFKYNMVGVEIPWFNANTLSYYASKQRTARGGGDCYYTAIGFGLTPVDVALRRVSEFRTVYFLSLDPTVFPYQEDLFNRANQGVLDSIENDGDYVQITAGSVPAGVLIFRHR